MVNKFRKIAYFIKLCNEEILIEMLAIKEIKSQLESLDLKEKEYIFDNAV